jgi:hypothetical protein
MTLEILQNHRPVGTTTGELPVADERGEIKYAGSFAIDKFGAGVYELKITVNNVSRSTTFVIAP